LPGESFKGNRSEPACAVAALRERQTGQHKASAIVMIKAMLIPLALSMGFSLSEVMGPLAPVSSYAGV
jgi:hypothetical protein